MSSESYCSLCSRLHPLHLPCKVYLYRPIVDCPDPTTIGVQDTVVPQRDSVCLEAESIVSTDRNKQYGSPLENLTRTANLLNDMGFAFKGKPLIAADAGLILLLVKVARLAHGYKRDSLVDTCGYAKCIEEVTKS